MLELNYFTIFLCFLFSFIITFINIYLIHESLIKFIKKPKGPQRIHKGNVPRLGGISIFLSIILMSIIYINQEQNLFFLYFIISVPIFILGILEDFTQSISPKLRLYGSIITAVLFVLIFQKLVREIGIGPIDIILKYNLFSVLFTLFSITYLIQAFNIIDGLNGLSLITSILCLSSIGIISYQIGDFESTNFSIYLIFILLGVLIFNFPFGKVFIGDSGAYIIGLYVAALSINLADKNISPFVIAQILIFPSYELLRSFIRRFIRDKKSILRPDRKHLHSILNTFNTKKFMLKDISANVLSSLQIIIIQLINFIYLINFYKNESMVVFGIILFIVTYEMLYKIIVIKIKTFETL